MLADSLAPATSCARKNVRRPAAGDDELKAFFSKSESAIHAEHFSPSDELEDEVAPPRAEATPRFRSLVGSIVGAAALLCIVAGATSIRRASLSTATTTPAKFAVAQAPAPTSTRLADPPATVAQAEVARAETHAAPALPAAATSAAPEPTKPAAAGEDDLSAAQLIERARRTIDSSPVLTVALARKALAKGAGGTAHYLMGAAHQAMGSTSAARQSYLACARSAAPEASECAALSESL